MNRRSFLKTSTLAGSGVLCMNNLSNSVQSQYDLVIKNGLVIDPSQNIHGIKDVAVTDGKVAAVEENIPASQAKETIDASGRIVAPGLIDLHVHAFWGVTVWGIEPDSTMLAKGSTTVVDAGSAGYYIFPGFKKYVIEKSVTKIYAFLNISAVGLISGKVQELEDMRHADVKLAVEMVNQNRDIIPGIKVRLGEYVVHENDIVALLLARQAAEELKLPLMVHIGNDVHSMDEMLPLLRPGDIVTHSFNGLKNGIVDEKGRILPVTYDARNRGIYFDVGHGGGSFHWWVADAVLQQGFLPSTISTDLHSFSVNGPVYDLPTTLTKFMILGMPLDKVIELTTIAPAKLLKKEQEMGSLRTGMPADVSILTLEEGDFTLVDSKKEQKKTNKKLCSWKTIKGGKVYQG